MTSLRDIIAARNPSLPLPPPVDDKYPPPNGVEAPMSPMAARMLPHVRETVAAGKDILVVGCLPMNLGPRLAEHPQVLLWSSQDDAKLRRASIPASVGVILLLKWVGHVSVKLTEEAKRMGIPHVPVPMSTGDVRQILRLALFGESREPFASDKFGARRTISPIYSYASENPPPPEEPPAPTPTEPAEPDPLPTPADPPPTAPEAPETPGARTKARAHGMLRVLHEVGANPNAPNLKVEARRIVGAVRATIPLADERKIADMLSYMRKVARAEELTTFEDAAVGGTTVQSAPFIPPPAVTVAESVSTEPELLAVPDPDPPAAPADVSIDEALAALAAAENAIHAAMGALVSARAQMAETIIREIETGVQSALSETLARFRK